MVALNLATIDFTGQSSESKKFDLSCDLAVDNARSIAYVVQWQLAKRRAGSAKTKTMAEISGTTAKPWKQKGTGRARQGSRRSVQFVGGRTCHGPMPRSFDFSMPKKIAQRALNDILKIKLKENKVLLFSSSKISESKTSQVQKVMENSKITSALIVSNENKSLNNSVRNLKNVKFLSAEAINVYDIVNHDYLIIENDFFENKICKELQ